MMNNCEIENCVINAKKGNREDLLKLLEHYKPFIYKTAKGYNIRNYDMYDLAQIGYVSLINAIGKYRAGSNTFAAYAINTIKNAFRYTARQNSKFNQDLSLNIPVDTDDDGAGEYMDSIESLESLEEDVLSAERLNELRRAVSKLSADDMALIIMVYYNGASLGTYANKHGISYQQAVRKKNRILVKLNHYIKR